MGVSTKVMAERFEKIIGPELERLKMSEGKKQTEGKTRLDLIPPEAIEGLGLAMTNGAEKYGDHNWRLGLPYSEVYGAAQRHLQKFWNTKKPDIDGESKLPHLYHALCDIAFLLTYEENKERYRTFDDRAGSNNEYYKKREQTIDDLLNLVQGDPKFFGCKIGDDKLEKLYETVDYAVNAPPYGPIDLPPEFPDLTNMTHPEACEHLEVGMRVKVLCRGSDFIRGWDDSWTDAMVESVGKTYTISTIHSRRGVTVEKYILSFPAFVLEIISRPEDTK